MTPWTKTYLLAVLEQKDWSANRLATETGLAASTINRPLRERDWKYELKPENVRKIHQASGIDPTPFMPDGLRESAPRFIRAPAQPTALKLNEIRLEIANGEATIHTRINSQGLAALREKLDALETIL